MTVSYDCVQLLTVLMPTCTCGNVNGCVVNCIVLNIRMSGHQLQRRGTESAGWQASPGPSPRPGAACCAVCVSRALTSQVLPHCLRHTHLANTDIGGMLFLPQEYAALVDS